MCVLGLKTMTIPNERIPRTSRRLNNVNGGITFNTTLLTTYIPPQMDAARDRIINLEEFVCVTLFDYIPGTSAIRYFYDYGSTLILMLSWTSGKRQDGWINAFSKSKSEFVGAYRQCRNFVDHRKIHAWLKTKNNSCRLAR